MQISCIRLSDHGIHGNAYEKRHFEAVSVAFESLRNAVIERAGERCEYCLLVDAPNSTFYRDGE